MKRFLIITLIFTALVSSAYKKPDTYTISPAKNAFVHNNKGLEYVAEKWYSAAEQEFKIAISLNSDTQSTAVYYNNLGEVYMKTGRYKQAQDCFEKATTQYSLNFLYYQNLAKSFAAQGIIDTRIKYYEQHTKNPLNMIMVGLLYIEKGNTKRGIIKLDEFCMAEPKLIITGAIKNYLKELTEKLN